MLPAYQCTDTGYRSIDCMKPVCVSLSPHKSFGVRGHALAMVIQELAATTTIDKNGIVQGSSARAPGNPLDDAG